MKKLFTLLFAAFIALGICAQTKIAYINTTADAYPEDTIYKIITAIPNTTVTVLLAQGSAQPASRYADYDIVVLAENVGSSVAEAVSLKDTLKKANKAFLNFKMFMCGKGTAPNTWKAMGAAANSPISNTANDTVAVIPSASLTHPLFNGITIPGDNKLKIIKKLGMDGWVTTDVDPKERGFQSVIFNASYTYTTGTVLARPESYKGIGFDSACIHEIKDDKYLAIGIFGGMPKSATKFVPVLTEDGYQIIKNAIPYLVSLNTSINKTKANDFLLIAHGNQFEVKLTKIQKTELAVYNITGRLIERRQINGDNAIIDLTGEAKGIYLIKVSGMTQKVIVK
jgi:hypothetical protein